MKYILIICLCVLITTACGGGRTQKVQSVDSAVVAAKSQQEIMHDKVVHYWDDFAFADSLALTKVDSAALIKNFCRYVMMLDSAEPMRELMNKASVSKQAMELFYSMAETVLYDPNSPMRNDELYIPVLESVIASPLFDRWEKIAPKHDLHLAMQNRIGQQANDFVYTLRSGAKSSLYGVKSDYTLVFINNPGCPMCGDVRRQLCASQLITSLVASGRLTVLAIYTDEDLAEWHKYYDEVPINWINGYDKGCLITQNETYDLKAIPALYLLNGEKIVLVKDSTDVGYIEQVLSGVI